MTLYTRANLLAKIQAKFPKTSLANPTNSDLQDILTDILDSQSAGQLQAVTATADGLTTGLVSSNTRFLQVTSASANNIVTLPAVADFPIGGVIEGYVGANGFKLSTPASSNQLINNVDSDGTQRAAVPANSWFIAKLVDATQGWVLIDETRLGARTAAIVPA